MIIYCMYICIFTVYSMYIYINIYTYTHVFASNNNILYTP